MQVPGLRAVVADAEAFLLAAGLGGSGARFDEGEDAVVALCERGEERVEGLHVLDCGEGLERALRAVQDCGCCGGGAAEVRDYLREGEVGDGLQVGDGEVGQGEAAARAGVGGC